MLRPGEKTFLLEALQQPSSNRWLAFRALARIEDDRGLPAAEKILEADESGRDRAEALRYLTSLPTARKLDLARQWVTKSDGRRAAAAMFFESHAEKIDAPVLLQELTEAWSSRNFYRICEYMGALGQIRETKALEQIRTIYEETEYSYSRRIAAQSLVAISQKVFSESYAYAALWDCEEQIQDLAVAIIVSPDSAASERIATIKQRRAA